MSTGLRSAVKRQLEAFLTAADEDPDVDPGSFRRRLVDAEARELFDAYTSEYRRIAEDLAPRAGAARFGPWAVESVLGRGGMADVYLAADSDGRRVALKVLSPGTDLDSTSLERLDREAASLALLAHPHIVRLIDHGVDDGRHYLAMELVEGGTLAERIAAHEYPLPTRAGPAREAKRLRDDPWIRQVVAWTTEILDALAAAHAIGIVHRDVKPANVLLDGDGRAKLADFGLAHLEAEAALTSTGRVLGTPGYVAPERLFDPEAARDPRVDLFPVATILFEGLTGRRPFPGDQLQVIAAALGGPPALERFLGTEKDRSMQAILERGLASRAGERYPTALEFSTDLSAWLAGRPVAARRGFRRRRIVRHVRNHRRRWAVAAAVGLALVAGGVRAGWQAIQRRSLARVELERADVYVREHAAELRHYAELVRPMDGASVNDWHTGVLIREEEDPRQLEQARLLTAAVGRRRAAERVLLPELDGPLREEAREALRRLAAADARLWELAGDRPAAERSWIDLATYGGHVPTARVELTTAEPIGAVRLGRYEPLPGEARWDLVPVDLSVEAGDQQRVVLAGQDPGSYLLELQRAGEDRWIRFPLVLTCVSNSALGPYHLPTDEEIGADWEYVPPGEFIAGGDPAARNGEPRTLRRLDYGFFMQRHEVTVGEYKAFLRDLVRRDRLSWYTDRLPYHPPLPSHTPRASDLAPPDLTFEELFEESVNDYLKDDCAIHSISYSDAAAYVEWLNESSDAWEYALPSGDEWEKAARGADGRLFPWGNSLSWSATMGGPSKLLKVLDVSQMMRPAQFPDDRSPYGIEDLGGNVREFCRDACSIGPAASRYHLVRGGEQSKMAALDFRAAVRWETLAGVLNFDFGIRLVRIRR